MCVFFFFKQKTAYELRISDWSSDVCSSDLAAQRHCDPARAGQPAARRDLREDERGPSRDTLCNWSGLSHRAIRWRGAKATGEEIGRAPCRERVGQYA